MGIFGWSLPPGCGALPGEEEGASDITRFVHGLPAGAYVYWLEDGALVAQVGSDNEFRVGDCEWNDEQTDEANLEQAACIAALHLDLIRARRAEEVANPRDPYYEV